MTTPVYMQHKDYRPLSDAEVEDEAASIYRARGKIKIHPDWLISRLLDHFYLRLLREGKSRQDARVIAAGKNGFILGTFAGFVTLVLVMLVSAAFVSLNEVMDVGYVIALTVVWASLGIFGLTKIVAAIRWVLSKVRAKITTRKPKEAEDGPVQG